MKRKFLSLLLALVMCLGLVPAAYAADTKWTGIVSDPNMTFDDTAAILADGTLKAWYAIDLNGKSVTAKHYELTIFGTGYKAIVAPNLLKGDGKLAALDNPALFREIFSPGIDNVAQISAQYSVVLKNDGSLWSTDKGIGWTTLKVNPALGCD